jgi:hypothetical protein
VSETDLNGVQAIENSILTIQRSLVAAYKESCPLKTVDQGCMPPYWDSQLGKLHKAATHSWNRRQSDPDAYQVAVKAYDKALRAGKRTSFLRDSVSSRAVAIKGYKFVRNGRNVRGRTLGIVLGTK